MKLIKKGVNPFLWESLLKMQGNSLFDNYYLVGGTALSLQIGHRSSEDIDLFTKGKINKEEILEYVKENISNDYKIKNNSNIIYQLFSEKKNLKLDFVQITYDLLDPLIIEEGIRMIDKNDIAAMKISASGTRVSEAKDFIDIYFLLQYMSFEKMMKNFIKKYQTDDVLHYLRSVIYFDDIDKENWESVKFLNKRIPDKVIKEKLIKEVVEYERNKLYGIKGD